MPPLTPGTAGSSEDADSRRPSVSGAGARRVDCVTIPGYRLTTEIHRGGQGVVYKAVRESTGQTVAIKVLRWPALVKPEERSRFQREVDILGSLRHPNIVRLDDGGTLDDACYFVMDFIEGEALPAWVGRGLHDVPDTLHLFLKLCGAVEAAHRRGIIHRDLKPGNILIDREGEPLVVDFGLAKIVSNEPVETGAVTSTGQFIGSVPWASPEQAEGRHSDVDVTTDVYGLGMLLYYMLTGRGPFRIFGSIRDMLDAIISDDPEKPGKFRANLGTELDTIILKSISKEQSRRYQSVSELRLDIERYLNHEPIEARRSSTWYVLTKAARRHRAVAALTGLLFAATVFYAVTMTVMFRRARLAEQSAERDSASAAAQFTIASDAIDFLIDEVDDHLDRTGHTQPARRDILHGASAYLERLATVRGESPALMRARARARTRLGKIALSLGAVDDAEAHFHSALKAREAVATGVTSTPLDHAEWSLALVRVGDCHKERGALEAAKDYYDRAYAIDLQLVAVHADNMHFLDNLIWSHERLGDLAWKRRDYDTARAHFERQASLSNQLLTHGVNKGSLWAKASSLGQLEIVAAHDSNVQRCYELSKNRVEVLERLVEFAPDNRVFRRMRAAAHAAFAGRAMQVGQAELALQGALRGTELARIQLSEDPDDVTMQLIFTSTMLQLGKLLQTEALLDLPEARSVYTEALAVAERSTKAAPYREGAWVRRFHLLCGQAAVAATLDEPDEAERLYAVAFNLADDIRDQNLVAPDALHNLADLLLGCVQGTISGTDAARSANEKYTALTQRRSP